MITDAFLDQRRVNVCEHTVKIYQNPLYEGVVSHGKFLFVEWYCTELENVLIFTAFLESSTTWHFLLFCYCTLIDFY